jgi:hypothetical protein
MLVCLVVVVGGGLAYCVLLVCLVVVVGGGLAYCVLLVCLVVVVGGGLVYSVLLVCLVVGGGRRTLMHISKDDNGSVISAYYIANVLLCLVVCVV